jgi:hypothetical protein
MNVRSVLPAWMACMLVGIAPIACAVAANEEPPATIRFLRVFAPEDRMKEWPLGEERYLPVDAAEFERLAAGAQSHASKVPGATIDLARYEAKLTNDQLVGEAAMNVSLVGSTPAMLTFEPCNLALGACTWNAADGERSKTPERAALGLTNSGKQELMVERSGRLSLAWSLDGRRDPGDIVSLSFEMPAASASQLFLELSDRVMPLVDRGMVVGSDAAGEHSRRWHIELGGNRRFRLRVVPAGTVGRRHQLALLRESRTYDITPRGLEVSAQWKLQAHNEPLQQIAVLLDPGLQLASARCGDASIPWSVEPSVDDEPTRVVLRLPEPIGEVERVVRLRALGRTILERPWQAPRIRGEGVSWQEGEITLLMPEPLVAERIAPYGCEQTATGPLSAPRTGESAQFQCFDPDATVELFLSRRTVNVQEAAASAIAVAGEESPARATEDSNSAKQRTGDAGGLAPAESDPFAKPADSASSEHDSPANGSGSPRAWVWNGSLQSWHQSDGTVQQVATYQIQNCGRDSIEVLLPHAARNDLHGVWVNGEPIEAHLAAAGKGIRVTVDLPAGVEYPTAAIQWVTVGPRLGIVGSLAPPELESDLPVLACRWAAWLPPGYEPVGSHGGSAPAYGEGLTWSRRLFGPLGRSAGQQRFNPLLAEHWSALADRSGKEPTAAKLVGLANRGRNQQPTGPKLPWSFDNAVQGQWADVQAEPAWCVDLSPNTPVAIGFVHCASMRLFGLVAFLLTVAVGCWKLLGRDAVLVCWLGGFCVVALLLPEAYAPIGSGGVLGVMFCLALRWTRRSKAASADNGPSSTNSAVSSGADSKSATVVRGPIVHLVVLGTLLYGGALRADSASDEPDKASETTAADASPLYRVFVPVDGQQKATGGKVYVPEVLYRELNRRGSATAEKPRGWLIVAATYRGQLSEDATTGRLSVDTLRAQYDLRVFGRATRVRIPLRPEGANLLPNSVLIDGRVIEPEWEPDGATLAFDVAEPGEYRLELALRPIMRGGVGPEGFDAIIPRVAASRLELVLPEGAPAVDVPSAYGATELEKDPPRLVADLGPADRLAVRWQEGVVSSTGPAIDVEQLMWLKVQPGSVVISAKFKLHVVEGQVQQVQLAMDPRLRLLPLAGDDPPSVQVGPETAESRMITFRWSRPISDQVTLDATFLLSGTLGVGNFGLPLMEMLDARPTQRWLAVTVDPSLDREEEDKQQLATATVSDFMRAWGAPESKPQTAYRLPAGETDWTLSTRPHEARTTADQNLTLKFDEDHVDVVFEADLSTTSGYLFQHRVTMPEGTKIGKVSLTEEGVERATRWSQEAAGAVTIFLSGPVSGRQKLALRGQIPIRTGVEWFVPAVRVEKCELHSAMFRLFRYPSVRLTVRGGRQGAGDDAAPGDADGVDRSRFVEAFSSSGAQPLLVAVVTEHNRPDVRAQQTVQPEWNGQSWIVKTDCRISVRGGVLDEICIRAPGPWNGPYKASLPGQVRIGDVQGENRQVIYRPQTAATDCIEFSIESPLEGGRSDRPIVPDIGLAQIAELERWFLLPSQSQGREVRWQTRGLTPSSWPTFAAKSSEGTVVAHRVTGEAARAVLAAAETPVGSARVQLADVALVWHADGFCYGTAAFDLEPGGVASCPLRLPNGCDVVQVLVEGTAVTPEAVAKGDGHFPLLSQRLPQRVEVLFRSTLPSGDRAGRRDFAAPMLGDLPVRQTAWSVFGPPRMEPSDVQTGPISDWQRDLLRLESAAAAIETANSVSADDRSKETPQWFLSWTRRLMVLRDALQRDLAAVGSNAETRAAKQKADHIQEQNVELARRLDAAGVFAQLSAAGSAVGSPSEILMASTDAAGSIVRCGFEGRADAIAVDYRPAEGDCLFCRLAAASGLALLLALGFVGPMRRRLIDLLCRRPHVVVAALGMGWWMWLSPSMVGLVIVLASIVAAGYSALAFDSKSSQNSRA